MIKDVVRGNTVTESVDFMLETCCSCGIPFFMPTYFYRHKLATKERFHCPNGHGMSYTGKTEAEKLKEQLEKLQQNQEKREEELQNRWLDALSEKQKLEKQLKRLHRGVCPCCNRSFANLQQHMKKQHPEAILK